MKVVLPGKPEAQLQALATGCWDSRRVTAYITGNAFSILGNPDILLQTVYDDDNEPLQAIALDEASGKIAVCTHRAVRIYKPFGRDEDALRWALQSTFTVEGRQDSQKGEIPISLSWGANEELLVAHSALELYQTTSAPECSWRKDLPNPARIATLSYDSAYIASVGQHDRLVKVWRRLSYGAGEVRFDFMYLPHPRVVTNLQWRRPHHIGQTIDNVLYTFCMDNFVRVWTGSDSHSHQHLQLWGKLDLAGAIQGREPTTSQTPATRWAFIIHGRDLSAATEKAVQVGAAPKDDDAAAALEHLISVANRSPELCVVLDGRGHMSAWAFENVGCKTQKSNILNVAHVESPEFDFLGAVSKSAASHVEIYNYCNTGGYLHILLHHFDGRVHVYRSKVASLLDPRPNKRRLIQMCIWTGHSAPITKIVRNFSGRAIVSRTQEGECVIWKHEFGRGLTLSRQSVIHHDRHIHRTCLLRKGRFIVFLHHDVIALWDCRESPAKLLAESPYELPGKPLCLLVLPRHEVADYTTAHIATITSEKRGIVWEVKLPFYVPQEGPAGVPNGNGHKQSSIAEYHQFELPDAGELSYVLPVDPAGSTPIVSGFLDVFTRDVAISYTHTGRVEFWTARVGHKGKGVEWLSTCAMETCIANPALVSGSTSKKAALVNADRSSLTIWGVRGERLEYAQEFEAGHTIKDLDWTSTPDHQSILAVGFPHRVMLIAQMRFDYLNKGPAWATIREINIRDLTPHPIGDSTWLGDGHLVIGAGNQVFTYDRQLEVTGTLGTTLNLPYRKGGRWDMFDAVTRLNGPLPVFHPQFLSQCILAGKTALVHSILMAMYKTLKFWIPGEVIDDYLGLDVEDFYSVDHASKLSGKEAGAYLSRRMSYDDTEQAFSEEVAANINEKLMRVDIPQLTNHEQIQLVDIVECAGMVEKQRRSLDENGARFLLFFRQHALRKGRTSEIQLGWREINWGYHSDSQDILLDSLSRQHHGRLLWQDARESGMFMWLTDPATIRKQFENIARNEYTKGDHEKNPVDCSLFYLALRKKTILQGLWRMASWNPEQTNTLKFLSNNFDDPKWRTAALKNAYALMSKRRFQYAAAFFLLASDLPSALSIILHHLHDLQLAITIALIHEPPAPGSPTTPGPVLTNLLTTTVLPLAASTNNRYLASWAYYRLRRRDLAVRALVSPIASLLSPPSTPSPTPTSSPSPPEEQPKQDLESKLFLTDDPALVILYAQLRTKTLQTLRGAARVPPRVEWAFVLHNARLYERMGCDLLGLDLVRNWEFLHAPSAVEDGDGEGMVQPAGGYMRRRGSSLVVADLPATAQGSGSGSGVVTEMKSGGVKPQGPPTVFEEPDANSLLDSFGF